MLFKKDSLTGNSLLTPAVVCLVAILGHLLVLKTFWFHDDWFFLSNAAGQTELAKGGSRWVSYVAYWKLMFPMFGLNPLFWNISRLVMHAATSLLVVGVGKKSGLGPRGSFLAGLLFASSPVAFDSVYWATGAIEIMGVFFTLAAIYLWLRGNKTAVILATLFGLLAIGSKEIGMLLPLLFLAHLRLGNQAKTMHWISVGILSAATVIFGFLLAVNLDGVSEYSLSMASIPQNFSILGFWLLAPPPFQTGNEVNFPWAIIAGSIVWVFWLAFALRIMLEEKNYVPVVFLIMCVLTLLPILPLENHMVPRYNYGPVAFGAIGLISLFRNKIEAWGDRWFIIISLSSVILAWGGTNYRINATYPSGRPIHRLVIKEQTSQAFCQWLENLDLKGNDRLVFLIDPAGDPVGSTILKEAIGGPLAPQLILGDRVAVKWSSHLSPEDKGAYVVSVNGLNLKRVGIN